jgi:hypothetical protein
MVAKAGTKFISKKIRDKVSAKITEKIKRLQSELGKDQGNLKLKDQLKDAKQEVKDILAPTPKLVADRKVDPSITKALKEQEAEGANLTPAEGKVAFKQTPAERRAGDTPKETSRVSNAKGSLTAAQMKTIDDAPTPQALTSVQAKMIEGINGLKKLTDAERRTRISNVKERIAKRKDKLREDAKVTPRGKDTRSAEQKPQSSEERQNAASGRVSSITTKQRNTKEGVGSMVSATSALEGKSLADMSIAITKLKAKSKLTKKEETMLAKLISKEKALRTKQAREAPKRSGGGPKAKKQPYKPESPFNKGGMAKKKATPGYAYGGMTSAKPRTGSTDYRMGGMFMKNGKK